MSILGQDATQSGGPPGTPVTREGSPATARWGDPGTRSALVVAVLTLAGVVLRLVVAHQSLFADELSTYWIIHGNGLSGVISTVHTDAEITPPLYFVLAWLAARVSDAPEFLRAPSLLGGAATIPLVYLLGLRTVGRRAALVATALTALAPFMIYYSAEARSYGLMMALATGSTLAMLLAVESRRARWWVVYAICSSLAVYSHYTSVFLLAAQLVWLLWAHPEARRPAILANVGAIVAFLPWTTGLINDFTSPTSKILSALSPFTPGTVRVSLGHWSIGYPYATLPLRQLPGDAALVMIALAAAIAVWAVIVRLREGGTGGVARLDRSLGLMVLLALSVPIGEAIATVVGNNIFGVRNLAASWPPAALVFAAMLGAAGPRLRVAATALAIAGFSIGAVKMVESRFQRPNFSGAAAFVDRSARPGDVIVDETAALSPGPYSPMDITLTRAMPVFRADAPQEHDHPFNIFDRRVSTQDAVRRAVIKAAGRRIFFISYLRSARFPAPYRVVASRTFPAPYPLRVQLYAAD